ncbi:tRNA dimethylallyltransferase [Candidatus Magnetomorum sp. HK-1]|nr:tRNA dimethylallyltransferase [Candidatus Magnetomorum sp. HK-1]
MKHTEKKLKPRIIIIAGPTCVGKTSVTIQLTQKFGGEIIGADAMQIYRHMNIGTAKPTPEEQSLAKHHMIDIVDPDDPFDAARYVHIAKSIIEKLNQKDVPVFVAGGSGLYIKTLTQGLFQQAPGNPTIRQKYKQMAIKHGNAHLYSLLQKNDPEAASSIHPNDMFRIIRALEVFEITGVSIKKHHKSHKFADCPYEMLKIMLSENREQLYKRIDQRVDYMIQDGFLAEVQSLIENGYHCQLNAMKSIGYKHLCAYLDNQYSWDETIQLMKRDTRRYAKRQFTWFRSDKEYTWTHAKDIHTLYSKIETFLNKK